MTGELTEAEIVQILREKAKASAHNRYMLNREVYKRRANARYVFQREEILAKMQAKYWSDPQEKARKVANARRSKQARR